MLLINDNDDEDNDKNEKHKYTGNHFANSLAE